MAMLFFRARKRICESVERERTPDAVIKSLGGCERACTLLALADLDVDGDGQLSEGELERFHQIGGQIVESAKSFHLNAGVVAALVLSVVFGLAYEENETLARLAETTEWRDAATIADLTSFIAMQLAVGTSFLTLLLSSRLYTQLAFWMPSLDAQLWLIDESAGVSGWLELTKNLTLLATLLALCLETAVTATWLDALALLPLAVFCGIYLHFERHLSARARARLGRDVMRAVAAVAVRHPAPPPLVATHATVDHHVMDGLPPPRFAPHAPPHAPPRAPPNAPPQAPPHAHSVHFAPRHAYAGEEFMRPRTAAHEPRREWAWPQHAEVGAPRA